MNRHQNSTQSILSDKQICTLAEAIVIAHEMVDEYFNLQTTPQTASNTIQQLRIAIEPLDLLKWLSTQTVHPAWYWAAREEEYRIAGIGTAERFTSAGTSDTRAVVAHITKQYLANQPELRVFGGFRFDNTVHIATKWEPFGSYCFFIPRIAIEQTNETYRLVVSLRPHDNPELVQHDLQQIRAIYDPPGANFILTKQVTDVPPKAKWEQLVTEALEEFGRSNLRKAVLSRRQEITCEQKLDPAMLLSQLISGSAKGTSFLFSPETGASFIGHSPERLYRRNHERIITEAVAGTRSRGSSPERDNELADELLNSDKELREHQTVSMHINDALQRLCDQVTIPKSPQIMKLANVQHLVTSFSGTLRARVSDGDIIAALHPTPAVAGFPTEGALQFIAKHEAHDRGWYAGPVGWISRDHAEFAVAIRSALIRDNVAHLFAGNGIVAGSVPEAEWTETEQKLSGMRKLFP